jgi:hypothetical protein
VATAIEAIAGVAHSVTTRTLRDRFLTLSPRERG